MTDDDHIRLLFGPYQPPKLKVGDRALCLYRDAEVVIYNWSMAPIPLAAVLSYGNSRSG